MSKQNTLSPNFFKILLFLGFLFIPTLTPAQTAPPPRLSATQALRWEVDQIRTESPHIEVVGNTIYLNNQYCPLSHTWIGVPQNRLAKEFSYKGKNKKFKGKTVVINFCCTACRDRFHKHFAKFPDEVLRKFGLE